MIKEEIDRVEKVHIGANKEVQECLERHGSTELKSSATLAELIRRPELSYEMLRDIISTKSRENLKNTLTTLLDKLIQQKYRNNSSLFNYLKRDIEDFAVEYYLSLVGEVSHFFKW